MAELRIRWTRQAIADVDNIYEFIAANSPHAARRIIDRIDGAIIRLTRHPPLGRPGRVPGTREFVIPDTRFIIAYRLSGQSVELLGVIHSARRWPSRF
jgi:addiction module RelE/StbE family toxin